MPVTRRIVTHTKLVPTTVEEPVYVLEMTEEEAHAVCALLGARSAGGDAAPRTYHLFSELDDLLQPRKYRARAGYNQVILDKKRD